MLQNGAITTRFLTKIGTQTKKNMLSSKITKAEKYGYFQDGRRCYLGNSSAC
jgi:hypothetical protein